MSIECQSCKTLNPKARDFCNTCGERIKVVCTNCTAENLPTDMFCGKCGMELLDGQLNDTPDSVQTAADLIDLARISNAERKQATILFSDMTGYSSISEKYDPEEVREFTSKIFSEISKVLSRYEGHIEKYVGDAVMVVFGIPVAHEDDSARAIRAALDINMAVESLSKDFEAKFERPLLMHSGIHTGVILTGENEGKELSETISGETVNIASRLTDMAAGGKILVGKQTYLQTERYFEFKKQPALKVKGLSEPLESYEVIKVRSEPKPFLGLSGRSSVLIGREIEMGLLRSGLDRLEKGQSSVFSLIGGPGAGKSRLLQEFKEGLDPSKVQFLTATAYSFVENIPYFIFRDLLSAVWKIDQSDTLDAIRNNIEENIKNLVGPSTDLAPHIGRLFDIEYAAGHEISPQLWKDRMLDGLFELLFAMSKQRPTIFCFEDLHWADQSSLEQLQNIVVRMKYPTIFILVSRPNGFVLENSSMAASGIHYCEIDLGKLSSSESHAMLRSLLGTDNVSLELTQFVHSKVEGNPFFLEEVVNAMIDTGSLVLQDGDWVLTKRISDIQIPITVNGVIAARLDNLEKDKKRLLQEASVIGRVFYYKVLKQISIIEEQVDKGLTDLEHLDLIRTLSSEPELEFIFKHALTQDTAYQSILIKERQAMHRRIGIALEKIFSDRLPDIYEMLAMHFKHGHDDEKAIHYLIRSGEKSLELYALEDAHAYFDQAIEMLKARLNDDRKNEQVLLDVVVKMAYVFYYLGKFGDMNLMLDEYRELADKTDDEHLRGMYYVWLGALCQHRERMREAYEYSQVGLELGKKLKDDQVIGYASAFLTWICGDLGLLDEAIFCGETARKLCDSFQSAHYLCQALGGLGYAYMILGDTEKVRTAGADLLRFGNKYGNVRGLIIANWMIGDGYFAVGDYDLAAESYKKAVQISNDPFYSRIPKLSLGLTFVMTQKYDEAEEPLRDVMDFGMKNGLEALSVPASVLLGIVYIAKGDLNKGSRMLDEGQKIWRDNGCRWRYLLSEQIYGQLQLEIVEGKSSVGIPTIVKNLSFIFRNVVFARRKAEAHFKLSLEGSKEIGAITMIGESSLGLGTLYLRTGRKQEGKKLIEEAIHLFQKTGAEHYIVKARELIETADR